jgi:2,4-dienoyl-CoA reductase-like NADH-dependent reductase (Old Yellow Enzyme family)
MPHLFDPFVLRGARLRNRIAVSPMCQYSCSDGFAHDWHLVHLGARAVGGAALVIAEATAVEARGRISPHDLGIWKDAHIEPLARIARFITAQGAVPGIQIAHAGRKASRARPWDGDRALGPGEGGWQTVAPSALAFGDGPVPTALSRDEIVQIRIAFVDAAVRAREAGFGWLELHAAHGYLAHEFLSPLANQRDDDYGGSFENRVRFIVEVARAVRAVWPEQRPLAVRVSATDWREQASDRMEGTAAGGWTLEDTVALALLLRGEGVDLIDCSSGGIIPGIKVPADPGYQVRFAQTVREQTGIATGAVGLISDAAQADQIVATGAADVVLIGRQLLRDPYWPLRAAEQLGHKPDRPVPPQYLRAFT